MKDKLLEIRCKQFADEGEKFSEEIRENNLEIINSYINHYSYFNICLAIALTWTKHAKHDFGFFDYAINFFENNELLDAEEIKNYSYRFGHISLGSSMNGLRQFKNSVLSITPDFSICDAKEIKKYQDSSLTILHKLIDDEKVSGVGPWLFLGPLKIIIGTEKRLWDDPNIDAVLLPTGMEVNRGIEKLVKDESPLARDFDPNWLVNEEQSLLEGISNDGLVQGVLQKIATIANTRVLHINSAFYLYGRR